MGFLSIASMEKCVGLQLDCCGTDALRLGCVGQQLLEDVSLDERNVQIKSKIKQICESAERHLR